MNIYMLNFVKSININIKYMYYDYLRTSQINFNYLCTFCKLGTSFSEFNKYLVNNQQICQSKINYMENIIKIKILLYEIYIYIFITRINIFINKINILFFIECIKN